MSTDGGEVVAVPGGSIVVAHGARTDAGRLRRVNEDAYLAEAPVFLVADGMGGHARGDAASAAVVETFRRHLDFGHASTPEQVLDAVHSANDAVRGLSGSHDRGAAVAGTTLAAVALVDAVEGLHWMVVNVGDSRVYAWDGTSLVQLSVDHSAVQELVDAGVIRAADAERHPDRNVITRALGAGAWVDPDVWLIPAEGRQAFLVCTDGLSKELRDDTIAELLAEGDDRPDELADRLVEAALEAGGRDNVTAVVVVSRLDARG